MVNVMLSSGRSLLCTSGSVKQKGIKICDAATLIQHVQNTVKLVYKDHPRDQQNVVLYTQVVFIWKLKNIESIPLANCIMWSL